MTLLKLINHEEISNLEFEHVVWIVAFKGCKLKKLQMDLANWKSTLDLSDNDFSGEIPASLGNLTVLMYLRFNNSLKGALPQSLANLTQFTFMDISYNNLSGPVPEFPERAFNIVGNPLICPHLEQECYSTVPVPRTFYTNISQGVPISHNPKRHKVVIVIVSSFGTIVFVSIALGLFIWCSRRMLNRQMFLNANDQEKEEVCLGNLRRFHFRELQVATNNFSGKNLLGKGGFGNVYKGQLQDGTPVDVKRLNDGNAMGGEIQFWTEVKMISLAVHRHLLRLYGICMTATERLLVYPYMSNGSVASRLKAKPAFDWSTSQKTNSFGCWKRLTLLA